MHGFIILAIIGIEKHTLVSKILTKSMEREMKVKGTGSRCVLVVYVKYNS